MRIVLVCLCLGFLGCSHSKSTFVSEDSPTMKEVYEEKFRSYDLTHHRETSRDIQTGDQDLNREIKREVDALRQEFRYLPNPLLTMYIFPHLTDAGTPVPGYTTFFKFYEKDHVGLPSEFPHVIDPLDDAEEKPIEQ